MLAVAGTERANVHLGDTWDRCAVVGHEAHSEAMALLRRVREREDSGVSDVWTRGRKAHRRGRRQEGAVVSERQTHCRKSFVMQEALFFYAMQLV